MDNKELFELMKAKAEAQAAVIETNKAIEKIKKQLNK